LITSPKSPFLPENWPDLPEDEPRQFLFKQRWRSGFRCPRCNNNEAWETKRGHYSCSDCNCQVSVTAGTIFHGSRKSLRLWFQAIWYITDPNRCTNARELQRILGFGSYHTAWEWLHKLRHVMGSFKIRLHGEVEVDKFYIGNKKGRSSEKALVIVAAENRMPNKRRFFILERVSDASTQSIAKCIMKNIKKGSIIRTDTWSGYNDINNKEYRHIIVPTDKATKKSQLSNVYSIISSFKKWLQETYSGAVKPSHLDYYLAEFMFKYNPKHIGHWDLFYALLKKAIGTSPLPGSEIKSK
jgi:transposase-like protein